MVTTDSISTQAAPTAAPTTSTTITTTPATTQTTTIVTTEVETTTPNDTATPINVTTDKTAPPVEDSSVMYPVIGGAVGGVVLVVIVVIIFIIYRRRKPPTSKKVPRPPHPDYVNQQIAMRNETAQPAADSTDTGGIDTYQYVDETITSVEPAVDADGYLKKRSTKNDNLNSNNEPGHIYKNTDGIGDSSGSKTGRDAAVGKKIEQQNLPENAPIYGNEAEQPPSAPHIRDSDPDSPIYGNEDVFNTYTSQKKESEKANVNTGDEAEEYVVTDPLPQPTQPLSPHGRGTTLDSPLGESRVAPAPCRTSVAPHEYVNMPKAKKGEAVFGVKPRGAKANSNQPTSSSPKVKDSHQPNELYVNTEHTDVSADEEYELVECPVECPDNKIKNTTGQAKYANLRTSADSSADQVYEIP